MLEFGESNIGHGYMDFKWGRCTEGGVKILVKIVKKILKSSRIDKFGGGGVEHDIINFHICLKFDSYLLCAKFEPNWRQSRSD